MQTAPTLLLLPFLPSSPCHVFQSNLALSLISSSVFVWRITHSLLNKSNHSELKTAWSTGQRVEEKGGEHMVSCIELISITDASKYDINAQ